MLTKLALFVFAQNPAVPAVPQEPDLALRLLDAVVNKNYWLAIPLVVMGAITLLRKLVPEHTKVGGFLHSQLGGWVVNFVMTIGGGLANSFAAGVTPTPQMLIIAIGSSFAAAGGWEMTKDFIGKLTKSNAQAAGKEAEKDPGKTVNQ